MHSLVHLHVFIPGLLAPVKLWQQDFAFQPRAPELLSLLAAYQQQTLPVQGLERSLLYWLGAEAKTQVPWAGLRHAAESGGLYAPPLLCADPVTLQTGTDCVLLQSQPPALSHAECERLITDLNTHLAQDGLTLKAFHPQRWYLYCADESFAHPIPRTTPPSEIQSGSVFPALPQSDDKYWQRLFNELQMLLHSHPVNQSREKNGYSPVNALWLWGEGDTPILSRYCTNIQGGGLSGQLLAKASNCVWQEKPLQDAALLNGEMLIILDQLQLPALNDQPQAWQHEMDQLQDYFAFLHTVLNAGAAISLYDAAGHSWQCQTAPGWQFWRRSQARWEEF